MTRPAIEVADIVRRRGRQFLERYQSSLSYQQLKAYRAVLRCRTAALGGHKDKCVHCQYEAPVSYNSCRSRCCPKCQAHVRRRWLEAQQRDLLNTNYFHVVFTLPHELNPLALTSPRPFLDLLFEASSTNLLDVAAAPPTARPPTSAFSSSCTHGAPTCSVITTSTASFPPAVCQPTISAGSRPAIRCSCCPFPS